MLTIRGFIANLFMRACSIFPLQDKVVFSSFDGKGINDNPGELYLEMKRTMPNLKYVWALTENSDDSEIIAVKPFSFAYLYHLATAKLWIDDSRKKSWTFKRKNQFYVQTWHGDVCIKMIEKDAVDSLSETYVENAKYDSQIADLMLSGSKFRTQNYRSAFWYDGPILEYGTPKATIFCENAEIYKEKVCKYYSIPEKSKIALYCPTFRSNGDLTVYDIDFERLQKSLLKRWDGEWYVIVRLHPKLQHLQHRLNYTEIILNGSSYVSTNELIMASDLIITDYSGCMFSGLQAHKTVILYTPDLDEYIEKERKLYFKINEMPFPLSTNNDELNKVILEFDEEKYCKNTQEMFTELGFVTTIDSTKRIVRYIIDKVWKGVSE